MKRILVTLAAVAALATGMAIAQSQHSEGHRGKGRAMMFERMAANLNLTDAQKEQAKAILAEARQSAQPVHDQLRQSRQALANAVKNGASEAEIDRLSNEMAPLIAKTTAIHSKAFAKFYATLTPEQKTKVGERMGRMFHQRPGPAAN